MEARHYISASFSHPFDTQAEKTCFLALYSNVSSESPLGSRTGSSASPGLHYPHASVQIRFSRYRLEFQRLAHIVIFV